MDSKLAEDPRIDPRLKNAFGAREVLPMRSVASREELLAEESSPAAQARYEAMFAMMESRDREDFAPSAGLSVHTERVVSQPDGNTINIQFIRPDTTEELACVYYIHGGAMQIASCYNGTYRAWGRMIAAQGVTVAMIDFRNCVLPSSVPEIAPFPAGLNDCVSGIRWLHAHSSKLNIDPHRIIVAGESGGGNLTLALGMKLKLDGDLGLIKGLYALCPCIAGQWPLPQNPSSLENNAILADFHNNRGAMAYGIQAFRERNPMAWPGFASEQDVRGPQPFALTNNTAQGNIEGFELEATILANKHLELSSFYAYTDGSFTKNVFQGVDYTNTPVSNLVKHKGSLTAKYLIAPSSKDADISLSAAYAYTAKRNGALNTESIRNGATPDPYSDQGAVPAYGLLNLRADWTHVMGYPLDLGVFVDNVTNKLYFTYYGKCWANGFDQGEYGPPRMFGVSARWNL